MERQEVYHAIDSERNYQDEKWVEFDDSNNSPSDWILYMEQHLQRCKEAIYDSHDIDTFKNELRKVTALGVACGEYIGMTPRE